MTMMKVSLPEAMKRWVEGRARSGRSRNASDYVCDLIRRDQEREARIAHMQAFVDEAIASGPGDASMADLKQLTKRKASC